jgi:dipeptidyl aminopeptidase/acylaminoacyl peptidase
MISFSLTSDFACKRPCHSAVKYGSINQHGVKCHRSHPFLKQSAHMVAKNYATPTLVLQGELDYRVPVSQGFEYDNTLRGRGVPARLLYLPDENHPILKPQNARLWHEEFSGWLARSAPGGGR